MSRFTSELGRIRSILESGCREKTEEMEVAVAEEKSLLMIMGWQEIRLAEH